MQAFELESVCPNKWSNANWSLGAHIDSQSKTTTFAVYSKHASRVVLEVFEHATGEDAISRFELVKNPDDDIWRAEIAGVNAGCFYGFRCWGPNWPFTEQWQINNSAAGFINDFDTQGNRFNPNKLLFDPYAREISHERNNAALRESEHNAGIYGTGNDDYKGLARREWDTARWAPKSIVVDDATPTGTRAQIAAEDAIIYEAHIRNLTAHPSVLNLKKLLTNIPGFERVEDIPAQYQGTYKGAAMMAPYLKALGITAIEFMPVHEVDNSEHSATADALNHWGYMTQSFFSPDRHFAHDQSPGGPTREFKQMVNTFHEHGIEVYLDVVYNHSGEGGNWGAQDTVGFTSLGGFDTTEYYVLTNDQYLVDGATGCGNQLNFSTIAARQLVIDSLSYWTDVMGVDGFRFDLATVLGRTPNAFDRENWNYQKKFFPEHPLLTQIAELGSVRNVEMIAEAWDAWGTYEVGNFPSGWGEWNGRYRDSLRRYLKGDGNTQAFMRMVNGDYNHFNDQGGPQKTINFITAHDGFNLLDLVSYNTKNNNQPYPFGPSDGGADQNDAWNSDGNHALRRQRLRNFWTLLFFSRGVPLVVSGDEFGRTQNGNNNPWNLNTAAMWNNYAMIASNSPTAIPITPESETHYHDNFGTANTPATVNPWFRFTAFVTQLRNKHSALRQSEWGNLVSGDADVSYLFNNTTGAGYPSDGDRCVQLLIDAAGTGDNSFALLINMWTSKVDFYLPSNTPGKQWRRIIDTASWAEPEYNYWNDDNAADINHHYGVNPWSVVVLQES
ncbi:glycogen operon protein [Alteromonadaceae bacterium 2753L.S.0a.02]|nr:glycogen operon protein [Alteromonadaceae bacterium 2753L.S.0a.02]